MENVTFGERAAAYEAFRCISVHFGHFGFGGVLVPRKAMVTSGWKQEPSRRASGTILMFYLEMFVGRQLVGWLVVGWSVLEAQTIFQQKMQRFERRRQFFIGKHTVF